MLVSADSKLIPFSLCTKAGCQWNGLSKADIRKITPKIKRQEMPEQDPKMRVHNFDEVPYGYTTETAMLEAERCLQCKNPKCVDGCPVNIDIPSFIALISEEKFDEAAKKIKETNVLPAVCGRVCPQESQCEELCIVGVKEEPVAIGRLERFVADYERKMDLVSMPHIGSKTNKKIAVVGSGPGGLTVAADMQLLGYNVTMFEALHEAGGVLTYGIPEFRLPKSIVNFEIDYLKKMGVRLELNHVIGQTLTVDELLENFDGIFIGVGAGLPWFMDLEGEYLGNVFSSNEYLTRMNLMKAYKFPEYDTPKPIGNKVAVIGGGNVAMDCARTAIRTGAKEVTIVYRRSRTELPARIEEIHHAEEEGINFKLLTSPIRYFGNDRAAVKAMECIQMELGEPDSSGRRRPVPLENSNFTMDIDMVIVAVGTGPNPVIFQTTPNLKRDKRGYIVVNEETMETSIPNVYAGGDIVTGSATVIEAMGAGRIAARAMHQKLSGAATKTKEEVVGVS
ncbi:MAG: NADPH-dependent glutamate synthase [Bacteroidetes bacterium]|nr:NADPH-dependent glutamate synthase [Bacteroidota bacterium]MBL6963015.1 NADPH-dependent glutamate synthase [Bacteroidota bacterium]